MLDADKFPKIKEVKINDIFQIMFSHGDAGQTLCCQVKNITEDEKNAPVVVFAIISKNSEHESVLVGGTSIYETAMGRHKDGIFTVNAKQWASWKWKERVFGYTSGKWHFAHEMAAAGKIAEAALTLDTKEEAVEFLSQYIADDD